MPNNSMNFGVDLIPTSNATFSLGNSSNRWILYADTINGVAPVTGVKGDVESTYRTGEVNLTAANIGAAAASHTHDYLSLTGGTLTGDLFFKTTWDMTTSPSSGDYSRIVHIEAKDVNNSQIGGIQIYQTPDGMMSFNLFVNGEQTGNNTLALRVAEDGTNLVYVDDPTAWRTALGLGSMATESTSSYLPLSGGTLTGVLNTTADINIIKSNYPHLFLSTSSDDGYVGMIEYSTLNKNMCIAEKYDATDSYREAYYLPVPDSGLTQNKNYYILTTKNVVTIPQGGTGATDAAGARTNLGLGDMATESQSSYLKISELAANTDLNNVRTFGFYSMGGYSNMSSIAHKPASDYACLAVLPIVSATNALYCVQYWFGRSGLWRSDYSNGTWSVWTNVTTGATVVRT